MDQRARHSRYSRNPFRAGHDFGATLVRNCYGLSGSSPPSTDLTGLPANGGFYFQAFSGPVALPAAGYNYNSVWTPLLAGLSPAGTAASLAALVRPCVARGFVNPADAVLHQCIRPLIGACCAPGHHGYHRAFALIGGQQRRRDLKAAVNVPGALETYLATCSEVNESHSLVEIDAAFIRQRNPRERGTKASSCEGLEELYVQCRANPSTRAALDRGQVAGA